MGFFKSFVKSINTFVDRVTTITPTTFTPANIIRNVVGTQVALYTGGLSAAKPQINGVVLASSDTNVAGALDSFYVGASSLARVSAGDPAIPETTINRYGRLVGGTVAALSLGSAASNLLTTAPSVAPGGIGPSAPLSYGAQFGNFTGSTVTTASTAYAATNFGQIVINVFGRQTGSAILQLLSGDLVGAGKTLSGNLSSQPVSQSSQLLYGSSQSSSGGGGGSFSSGIPGQSSLNPLWYVVGVGVVIGLLMLLRRK